MPTAEQTPFSSSPLSLSAALDLAWVRAQFPALAQKVNGQPAVFLDGPGGTQVPQRVIDAIADYLAHNNANTGGSQRPNLVPGVNLVPQNQSISNWINPAALAQPAAFTFGDAPRVLSNFHGPRYFNWDMGIEKSWHFAESKQLQFRFEMFNALNHPDFFQPDANLGDGNFGKISAAYPSRSAQFAGKFYF